MSTKNSFQKQGILIFDEMKVRESVELNVKNMKLIGLQDFGTDHPLTAKTSDARADHALVFMFSSFADDFQQPVAVYASKGPTKGSCLAQLILAAINKLEKCGARINGVVCDGATTNRKMWCEFGVTGNFDNPINKIVHPMDDTRHLYFLSDVPHLIKCIRNRFLNKQILETPEGVIKWDHYERLFKIDTDIASVGNNCRYCPKITEAHINPNNFDKMRVKLATQIFSNSVAVGLNMYKNQPGLNDCDATINFTKQMNDMFDCLNRKYKAEGIRPGSKDIEMMKTNLEWLNRWEGMVNNKIISADNFLTKNTSEGLRISLLSTIELTNYLLTDLKFSYVLTNKMNQDPIERFFGIIRQAGGANDHPTFTTFLHLYRLLSVYKVIKPPAFGNCTVFHNAEKIEHITFEQFKAVFQVDSDQGRKAHFQKIREYLDAVTSVQEAEDDFIVDIVLENLSKASLPEDVHINNIIYFLSGFICKKVYKASKCLVCRQSLYHTSVVENEMKASSTFTESKSRGYLNHPTSAMFKLFESIEDSLKSCLKSIDVFEEVLENLTRNNKLNPDHFPCNLHKFEVITQCTFFYISMRIKQYYAQEKRKFKKQYSRQNKLSKLQSH